MTPLETVFKKHLPSLLDELEPGEGSLIGFVAEGGGESGYWVVDMGRCLVRRGRASDRPAVELRARADVLVLLFSGQLDIPRAIEQGTLTLAGDREALLDLEDLLNESS